MIEINQITELCPIRLIYLDKIMGEGRKNKAIEYYIDKNGCWVCVSHTRNKKGYARITIKNLYTTVHRVMYQKFIGEIPKSYFVMHKCDNPNCINPKHLTVGTNKENIQDSIKKGRFIYGEKSINSKLKEKDVLKILKDKSTGIRELGRKYGVAHTTIIRIKQRKKWKYLSKPKKIK